MSTIKFAHDHDGLEILLERVRRVLASISGREIKEVKDREVAEALDTSPSAIPTWRKRGTIPYSHLVIFAFVNDISLDWLFYGGAHEGARLYSDEDLEGGTSFYLVPVYDVVASAGHGASLDGEAVASQVAFRSEWIVAQGWKEGALAGLYARGDSMEPTIQDGSLLLINTEQKSIREDGIYVIRIADQIYAKRIQRMMDGSIYIKSDNPSYDDQVLEKTEVLDLTIIGQVVWIGSKL